MSGVVERRSVRRIKQVHPPGGVATRLQRTSEAASAALKLVEHDLLSILDSSAVEVHRTGACCEGDVAIPRSASQDQLLARASEAAGWTDDGERLKAEARQSGETSSVDSDEPTRFAGERDMRLPARDAEESIGDKQQRP